MAFTVDEASELTIAHYCTNPRGFDIWTEIAHMPSQTIDKMKVTGKKRTTRNPHTRPRQDDLMRRERRPPEPPRHLPPNHHRGGK